MHYCIQCIDQTSGKRGDFGYDPAQGNTAGKFHAITPVFPDLVDFYAWARQHKIELQHPPYPEDGSRSKC